MPTTRPDPCFVWPGVRLLGLTGEADPGHDGLGQNLIAIALDARRAVPPTGRA